jgi:hypothetical protein
LIKSDIQKIIKDNAGELASIASISKALMVDRHTISYWLIGVPFLPVGKSKRYLASDVAEKIIQLRKV